MHGPCQEIEFPEVCDDLNFSAFVIDQFIKYIKKRPYQAQKPTSILLIQQYLNPYYLFMCIKKFSTYVVLYLHHWFSLIRIWALVSNNLMMMPLINVERHQKAITAGQCVGADIIITEIEIPDLSVATSVFIYISYTISTKFIFGPCPVIV